MDTLERLALERVVRERLWREKGLIFKQLATRLSAEFIQECLDQNNLEAFMDLVLNLQQDTLVIRHNPKFTVEFALRVLTCVEIKARWKDTRITSIDFGGCEIGPVATGKFCRLAKEQQLNRKSSAKGSIFSQYYSFIMSQDWFHANENLSKISINIHVTRGNHKEICQTIRDASSFLKPFGIKADAIGRDRVCELLGILCEKNLPLYELDLCMNSLGVEGVVPVCALLSNFRDLQCLDLSYAMISETDYEAAMAIGNCLQELRSLQSLKLKADMLGHNFPYVFNNLPVRSLRILDLTCCGMPANSGNILAEKLKDSAIHSLYLSLNSFKKHEEFQVLLLLLTNCKRSLRKLDISKTALTNDNTMTLIDFFIRNRQSLRLEWLSFDNGLLNDEIQMALPLTEITWVI